MAYALEAGNATAYGNLAQSLPNAVAKQATIQSIIENFDPLIGRLEVLANRAANCGDKITGARPQTGRKDDNPPEPNHLIWAAQARASRLQRVIDVLESEIGRIEN